VHHSAHRAAETGLWAQLFFGANEEFSACHLGSSLDFLGRSHYCRFAAENKENSGRALRPLLWLMCLSSQPFYGIKRHSPSSIAALLASGNAQANMKL
jgi:hypothetical protein